MGIFTSVLQNINFIPAVVATVIGFFVLNRDAHLRMLERENKRHRFWKEFYEAQDSLPGNAKLSSDELDAISIKCKQDIDRSFSIVMGHAKLANSAGIVAGLVAAFALSSAVEIRTGFFSSLFVIGEHVGFPIGSLPAIAVSWFMQIAAFGILYQLLYSPARDQVRSWMLDLQRKKATRK